MKKSEIKVTRYEQDGFYIDIVKLTENYGTNEYEAWLQHKDYGISKLMFGCMSGSIEQFLNIVDDNLNEQIEFYYHEVINNEE